MKAPAGPAYIFTLDHAYDMSKIITYCRNVSTRVQKQTRALLCL